MDRLSKGFALFMNWFNGICATLCGAWMLLSAITPLPLSWNDLMPVALLSSLPLPEFMKVDFFWSGLALFLVNGLPNIVALILHAKRNLKASYAGGIAAGLLLIAWTLFELAFIPNAVSGFYLVLGVLQTLACLKARSLQ